LIGFTKVLAIELARKGVTVNAVAPGMIETDMIKTIPPKYAAGILDRIPAQRFGRPEEVADLLQSPSASLRIVLLVIHIPSESKPCLPDLEG
jgi:NAD(P)-dependent dehydrogenase (short-subunit alcohol dehydrogenase family)